VTSRFGLMSPSLPKNVRPPISANAPAHGQKRREQGYSPAMLIEESRIFQIVTFGTLHLHRSELDQRGLLRDVVVIRGRGGRATHGSRAQLDVEILDDEMIPPRPHNLRATGICVRNRTKVGGIDKLLVSVSPGLTCDRPRRHLWVVTPAQKYPIQFAASPSI
jgi:hypothetical protein